MTTLDQIPLLPRPRTIRPAAGCWRVPHRTGHYGLCPPPSSSAAAELPAQGYRLDISPAGLTLEAADAAGAFYGRMTLRQLERVCDGVMPCGIIEDWPDLPVRGVMLDISRDKVPTMDSLRMLVDSLAEWKINHLELYMEHTFAYQHHREVWASASPLTADEVRSLDVYCRERFIELAPNQNSFGHFERWLRHPRYRPLAECPDGFEASGGTWRDMPTTLDPTQPGTLTLIKGLYAELLPNFTSHRLHIGCDETWELGKGRSRAEVDRLGLGRVYLDYLEKLKALAAGHGRTALYWGDMVWNHFPDQLDRLDREMTHVDWGYYRDYPYREHGEKLAAAGIPFWVAPGTGVWSTLTGCNEAAFGSNRSAARCAVEFGAKGYLNTDWGDGGHWQHLPVSFIGLAAGAAMSWGEARNDDDTIRAVLDPQVFEDPAGVTGGVAHALGDTWTLTVANGTQANLLDRLLRGGLDHVLPAGMTEATLSETEAHLETAIAKLAGARMRRSDAALIVDEFSNNARLAQQACRLGCAIARGETGIAKVRRELAEALRGIIAERRRLWLARNRPGGLDDSLRVLVALVDAYDGG